MTIWENIYKHYLESGEVWATISEEIHPLFKKFLDESNFDLRHVLDVGCGTGKYLRILQAGGFETDGIDSGETAVEMTKKLLNDDSLILLGDMFEFDIPKNKYDLVVSILTIHHGTKQQIQNLMNRIYDAIIDGGKIFITVPDMRSSEKWNTFQKREMIARGSYAPLSGPEKGLIHSFYTEEEVLELFKKFGRVSATLDDIGRWVVSATK
ncbi:MAG: class I SAM-dependent methyltransferase [Patescibacteria group bacterium]|jgi:SAM-dependent methyltransferase